MKQSPKIKKQPQDGKGWSLNDAVNDENFEMKKSAPMNRYSFNLICLFLFDNSYIIMY